ncbi:MAG: hypothetical protein A2508_03765 [Candidatus Lambdaproteobacteria bacterium RIFOXYD12_FULL_49_8]|uniref:Uncharacterized protein n=1 Tax=Candidatus Lambdaproteobacteria bacterium RIFOXYD2_FULL_50_16 TaxID=1817772 RepID=A0A1F6G958_9PROT|nr:MAG: hypothetical protein A2527_05385 [Candidatus Lambdaproteobacteria bacterium RIFOXYD2_FULL_50_16]OGG97491.1 MAG: hypothetical protein A2508_03765 [Candidatus Lambdaproteobacteria bacterium RIFOXYD12_FULL_49_8]
MKNQGTLILTGLGLNCEKETEYACLASGAKRVDLRHSLDLLRGQVSLKDYDFLIFIGGFLDGDYLGSARVGANRYKYGANQFGEFKDQISEFSASGRLILGICNGFQLLVKLGLLPFEELANGGQSVSLAHNRSGIFEDRWVHIKINPKSKNIFCQGMDEVYLPVRHGEGRLVVKPEAEERILACGLDVMAYADEQGKRTEHYPQNPNGSWAQCAGLGNQGGNILGLMPHPEAYNHYTNHPHWTRLERPQSVDGEGLRFFKNAYRHLQS